MFIRKFPYIVMAAVSVLLSGCDQKDDRLLGTWVTPNRTLEFKKDGQFTVREKGTDQAGTWQRYGPDINLTLDGQEMTCSVNGSFENQLMLVSTNAADPQSCSLASPYWRLDLPAERRASSLVAFNCQTKGEKLGRITYTPEFRIEADKNDKLACFGKTSTGCEMVWFGSIVADDAFSMSTNWGDGTGDMFDVMQATDSGKLELRQSSSTSCGAEGSMFSCVFSSYTPVGTCEKVAP